MAVAPAPFATATTHPVLRVLLVIEIKTRIADIQALLGPLDVKERLAREVARRFGWEPVMVVPMIVVEESSTCRRRVDAHASLFARFVLRGRDAISWLRRPDRRVPGLLVFTTPAPARSKSGRRAGRQRVRRSGRSASVKSGSESAIQTDAAV